MSQSTEKERMQLALERLQCAVEEPSIAVRFARGGPMVAHRRSHPVAFPALAPSAKLALPRSSALKAHGTQTSLDRPEAVDRQADDKARRRVGVGLFLQPDRGR